jgi:Flp pilus assembly protein TadD
VKECEKGLKAREKGQTGRAVAHLEKAVRLAPDYCLAHIHLGVLYHSLGRLEEAEEAYLHARRLSRNNPLPLINLGEIYLKKGQTELAIEMLREATSITPTPALAFYSLGIALLRADELTEAEKALLRAKSLDPKLERVRLILANVYLRTQDPGRRLEQLEAYLDEYPEGTDREQGQTMRSAILGINGPPRHKKETVSTEVSDTIKKLVGP